MNTGWQPADSPLWTIFASDVSPLTIANNTAYPRPMMARRQNWHSLNGIWQVDFTVPNLDSAPFGQSLDYEILLPFPVESPLSGIRKNTQHGYMWYRRELTSDDWLSCDASTERTLLHFEASDWNTTVFVNGQLVGDPHLGGYDPFSFDITDFLLPPEKPTEIVVGVHDPTQHGVFNNAIGKQDSTKLQNPSGLSYTSTSGIWATVWMECVCSSGYIRDLQIDTSDTNHRRIKIDVDAVFPGNQKNGNNFLVRAILYSSTNDGSEPVTSATTHAGSSIITLKSPDGISFRRWTPTNPYLYNLQVDLLVTKQDNADTTVVVDTVTSYVGVRTIHLGHTATNNTTHPSLLLNGQPIFQLATLDQGFSPDGNYAYATDEAMAFDIKAHKQLGFNTIRKHVKMESRRWYYHCDRLGILVWQDLPSRTTFLQRTTGWKSWWNESSRALRARRNHPSIVQWIAFNEGWGQEYPPSPNLTKTIVQAIQEIDSTRLVTDASGGRNVCANDTNNGDVNHWVGGCVGHVTDAHVYCPPDQLVDKLQKIARHHKNTNMAYVLGEFGGVLLKSLGHEWAPDRSHGGSQVKTHGELEELYHAFAEAIIVSIDEMGLSGGVYTQITDVETECNGLLTYDRIMKVDPAAIAASNAKVIQHFQEHVASRRPPSQGESSVVES
ncbi:family 2 [Seminavis robusta]|uniref:Family 2 n=1 Tax=Seminavis robusta TaxID=568900 RepID=A0A9N8H1I3_9STRA|nr:family 2 [Seminavis robusta]|eukprot:Sro17_g012570.1 family 2 (666) ;mRNA; f:151589-153586